MQDKSKMSRRIAVIGAGVMGLSSAVLIQRQNPDVQVTILSKSFGNETTSSGPGGFFRPNMLEIGETDKKLASKWTMDSWQFLYSLANSSLAVESGMSFVSGVCALHEPLDPSTIELLKNCMSDYQELSEEQLRKMQLNFKYGYSFTTIVTHAQTYMRFLTKLFWESGGKIKHREVKRLADLASEFELVVNCCGLGGKDLLSDNKMFPIKGHLVHVDAPWVTRFFFTREVYLIPHTDKLLIGSLKVKGDDNMVAKPEDREKTLAKAIAFFPHLANAKVVGEWVGIRPGREKVRLETELVRTDSGSMLPVIHNYGHGGHGITLSWGCALNAAKLAQEALHALQARL